ncbi:hypothetical protein [Herbaspirillum frisingense]|uniref:hypothetical protein n=1 Tax=Herbaspirillum frisingense TaxID=92645 RepID=UPI001F348503|nr:hypothetical protein [Herbaspirillum frisingense]UIN21429.1 hypothetical protein LAZ82_23805 [Herbaspirillum frisingense]
MKPFSATFAVWVLLSLPLTSSHAQSTNTPSPACVEVEVNGVRSQSFSCLTEKLQPKTGTAQGRTATPMASEQIINQPGNQLGVFNRAALGNRMGNTLGTSVYPQHSPASGR